MRGRVEGSSNLAANNFAGLQLAPALHAGVNLHDVRGGVTLDLSVGRWLDFEAWLSRLSRPLSNDSYPGAWSTGVAINSRVARGKHGFVYGVGLVYTSSFECPQTSTLMRMISAADEGRIAEHVFAAQPRMGYEARFSKSWFVRPLWTWDLPFATGTVWGAEGGKKQYRYHEPPLTFMYMSFLVTVGFAYRLPSKSKARILRTAAPHRGGF
jgi:hypothetical protein